jgi:hypothetical protein
MWSAEKRNLGKQKKKFPGKSRYLVKWHRSVSFLLWFTMQTNSCDASRITFAASFIVFCALKCLDLKMDFILITRIPQESACLSLCRIYIFWNITPSSSLKVSWRFGVTFRLHLQGRRTSSACHLHHDCFLLGLSSTLKMEATRPSEMSVDFHRTTRRYITEHRIIRMFQVWFS